MHNFRPGMKFSEIEELIHAQWLDTYTNSAGVPTDVLKELYPNIDEFGTNGDAAVEFLHTVFTDSITKAKIVSSLQNSAVLENFKMEWRLAPNDVEVGAIPYSIADSAIRDALSRYQMNREHRAVIVYVARAFVAPGILPEHGAEDWPRAVKLTTTVTDIIRKSQVR